MGLAQTHPVVARRKTLIRRTPVLGPPHAHSGAKRSEHVLGGPRRRAAKRAPAAVMRRNPRGQQSTYDAMGSLIAVSLHDGRLIEYVTDGKGRRIGKMVNGVLTKQWLYRDQLQPVAELDGTGNLVSEFIYGTKANTPDLVIRGGNTYRIVSDQLGSPVLAINTANSSDVPFQATYAAFGERTIVAGTDDWMPFGFAGGQFDPDTKLTRFGARDYNSTVGRWVSKDALLFGGGQTNIYAYCLNEPVNHVDQLGLDPTTDPLTAAFTTYIEAMDSAEAQFHEPGGGINGPGDAYRHCLASCWLTQNVGGAYAKFFGWLNETFSPDPDPKERQMDESNNSAGCKFGEDPENDCQLSCLGAALNGQLTTIQ